MPSVQSMIGSLRRSIRSESYVELFRRALLPGPNGRSSQRIPSLPYTNTCGCRVLDVDTSWRKDSIDIELVGVRSSMVRGAGLERRSTVTFKQRTYATGTEPLAYVSAGRKRLGGAARYVRFDGLRSMRTWAQASSPQVMRGLTVLPRWDGRPGYHHLGSAADSLLRDPNALPEPERSGYKLGGGRFGWTSPRGKAGSRSMSSTSPTGLREGRWGSMPARVLLTRHLGRWRRPRRARARRIQDARLWVDATPVGPSIVGRVSAHRAGAVLVASIGALGVQHGRLRRAGGSAVVRVTERFAWKAAASSNFTTMAGAGREASSPLACCRAPAAHARALAYARVVALDNGYHALRASFSRRILPVLSGTLEAYSYLYDEAIHGRTTSEVYGGTLRYQAAEALNLLWGRRSRSRRTQSSTRRPCSA